MIEGILVIGENLNATRKIIKTSNRLVEEDGKTFLKYTDTEGVGARMDLTEARQQAEEANSRFIPYIAEGIRQADTRWAQATAVAQVKAGSDFIDLCVDECSTDTEERWALMKWLIEAVLPVAGEATLALDSSDSDIIGRGLERITAAGQRAMVNSINLEADRRALIPAIVKHRAHVVANASGEKGLPKNAEERIANLDELQAIMTEAGIPMGDRHLDPLVLPVATDTENGNHFLGAVRAMREKYPEVHITGGLSNVSFGLPQRMILNNAMTWLHKQAGGDSAILDPMTMKGFMIGDPAFDLAVSALEGRDFYCAEYTAHCRAMQG